MAVQVYDLLLEATSQSSFTDHHYIICYTGTLLTITNSTTSEKITIFLHQIDSGVEGFIQHKENEPFDPFYFARPLNDNLEFKVSSLICSLHYYPFDYCSEVGEYPLELTIFNPMDERLISVEVSFDGNLKVYSEVQP